jgi:hypothetical protein
VTPKDIKRLTGIQVADFMFENESDPTVALDELLSTWIEQISSHVEARLHHSISVEDTEYQAIQDVVVRTVAKVVAVAQQQRSSPVIQINDFAVSILNTSEVTKDLDKELKPFQHRKVSFFSSLGDYEGV